MSKITRAVAISLFVFILIFAVWNLSSVANKASDTEARSTAVQPVSTQSTTTDATQRPYVKLKTRVFYVEVAKTDAERSRGLSGRPYLPEDAGMFFVFERPGKYGFWMYEMRFSIDIVWLDESKQVVHIVEKALPCIPTQACPVFVPDKEAKYVLEVNAGVCEKVGLKIGDVVEFSPGLAD
ncbi:MAG: DUF192 domain-containing protein [Candidatus Caldarchaeum sp.]|nr:DUF192 domain-containing protein [Candidatus Caldarchaeum sp.]